MKQIKILYKTENIYIKKTKGHSFEGELEQNILLKHLKALGLTKQLDFYKIEGDFSIQWDDDIPFVAIESLYLINPLDDTQFIKLDLDRCFKGRVLFFDGEDLENKIYAASDSSDWYSDRLASLADKAYDEYKDRMSEGY